MKNYIKTLVFLWSILLFLCNISHAGITRWVSLHKQADQLSIEEIERKIQSLGQPEDRLYVLGLVYFNAYQTQQASEVFDELSRLSPESREASWGQAEVLRRQHRFKESVEMLASLIKQNKDYAPAFITLAYIRYIQLEFQESARLSAHVINLGDKNVDKSNLLRAHGLYGTVKGMMAHYGGPLSKVINGAAVLKHLNIMQKIDPDSAIVNFGLGSYCMLIPRIFGQDLEKAEEFLLKAREADPLFADIYVRLAQIYRTRKDYKKYEDYLNKALSLDPQNEIALDIKTRSCKFICLENRED